MRENNNVYQKILYLAFLFFIASFVGGLLESFYLWFLFGNFKIGGFMYGPWKPIYGFGCLLIYFITQKNNKNKSLIFLNCMIICSLFEYASSLILEVIFDKIWWDYSDNFFNINGRICLLNSLIWGIMGLAFYDYVEPFMKKLFQKIHIKKMVIFLFILFSFFLIDIVFSLVRNFS